MQYQGFRSISEYEQECARTGFKTERIPVTRGGESFFVLLTGLRSPSPSAVRCWSLFTADESEKILDGVDNGHYANYLGKIEANGFQFI